MPLAFRLPARAPLLALAALLALPTPAPAQWLAVGRWGSEQNFRYVAPGTWMVLNTDSSAEASADGDNHVTRLTLSCRRGDSAARVELSRYFGYALPRSTAEPTSFLLVLDDIRIELDAVWSEGAQGWVAETALDSDALSLFRGARALNVLGPDQSTLATYRMNGSTAMREALQRRCGI